MISKPRLFVGARPLVVRVLPAGGLLRDAIAVVAATFLLAACAQIAIPLPFTPVPITGQTFAVLLIGATLGSTRGSAAIILYLLEGAAGLPFFAPTGGMFTYGYLAGFVPAAFVAGWLCERGWDRDFRLSLAALLIANAVIYAVGLPWLASAYALLWSGADVSASTPQFWQDVFASGQLGFLRGDAAATAVATGLLPFIPGDLVKAILAAAILPGASTLVSNWRSEEQLTQFLGDRGL